MATKKQTSSEVEAFVLVDCVFGKAGDVVTLSPTDAERGERAGMLDLHPDAIKSHKK